MAFTITNSLSSYTDVYQMNQVLNFLHWKWFLNINSSLVYDTIKNDSLNSKFAKNLFKLCYKLVSMIFVMEFPVL